MKKNILFFITILLCTIFPFMPVEAIGQDTPYEIQLLERPNIQNTEYDRKDDFDTNCADFASTIKIGGVILFFAKIILPIVIIVVVSMNMMKTITAGKSDEIAKQAKKAGTSLIAAIIVFFLPTIVYSVFDFVDGFKEGQSSDAKICYACIFDPYGSLCTQYAKYYKE